MDQPQLAIGTPFNVRIGRLVGQRQHPHLTLGQIHSCLAYYYDHQQELDQIIEEQLRSIDESRRRQGQSALRLKLAAKELAS
jgi:hypothetical protein